MTTDAADYLNPVYSHSFPDPFVLKFCGEYYAYCTGFARDGNVFGVLRSADLVQWHDCGGAMKPLEDSPPFYWAPEVTYANGKFYLYYSVGNETLMEIRVDKSGRGEGKMAVATKISFDKKNKQIELENYGSEPVRLNNLQVKVKS